MLRRFENRLAHPAKFFGISYEGVLHFYENEVTPSVPRFDLTPQTILSYEEYLRTPVFIDYDFDGDYDLFFTNMSYGLCYYENIGTPQNANFEFVTGNFAELNHFRGDVSFGDIDNDGDWDLFYGMREGGIKFYRNLANPLQVELKIAISGNDITLNWSYVANAVEYRIFYGNTPCFEPGGLPATTVYPPVTSRIDPGALEYGPRFYKLVVAD